MCSSSANQPLTPFSQSFIDGASGLSGIFFLCSFQTTENLYFDSLAKSTKTIRDCLCLRYFFLYYLFISAKCIISWKIINCFFIYFFTCAKSATPSLCRSKFMMTGTLNKDNTEVSKDTNTPTSRILFQSIPDNRIFLATKTMPLESINRCLSKKPNNLECSGVSCISSKSLAMKTYVLLPFGCATPSTGNLIASTFIIYNLSKNTSARIPSSSACPARRAFKNQPRPAQSIKLSSIN